MTYNQIRHLLETYAATSDLVILAFPSNDFHQERGSNEEIAKTVSELLGEENYDSPSFVLFEKSELDTNPVYQTLQSQFDSDTDGDVKGNFFKYLVDRNGRAVTLLSKKEELMDFVGDIRSLLLEIE